MQHHPVVAAAAACMPLATATACRSSPDMATPLDATAAADLLAVRV